MQEIELIINVLNGLNVPAWIPLVVFPVLRYLELKFNIFKSKHIKS